MDGVWYHGCAYLAGAHLIGDEAAPFSPESVQHAVSLERQQGLSQARRQGVQQSLAVIQRQQATRVFLSLAFPPCPGLCRCGGLLSGPRGDEAGVSCLGYVSVGQALLWLLTVPRS